MNVTSQKEMFNDDSLAPARIPRITPLMATILTALLYRKENEGPSLRALTRRDCVTRTLRRMLREGLVEVQLGSPTVYRITRLGHIARQLRNRSKRNGNASD